MTPATENLKEAGLLIEALCHEQITAAEMGRLDELLLADPAVRGFYVRYLHMHAALPCFANDQSECRIGTSAAGGEMVELGHLSRAAGARPLPQPVSVATRARQRGPAAGISFPTFLVSTTAGLISVSAALLAIFMLGRFATGQKGEGRELRVESPAASQPSTLNSQLPTPPAVLAVARNCHWAGHSLEPGQALDCGRPWKLDSGLAEIEFACGARAILQGPATIEIRSASAVMLHYGRLSARMTGKKGGRFVVHTPRADVVDLGTEFGVDVDPQFNAMVRVFSGEVELSPVSATHPLRLTTNQAAQFDSRTEAATAVDPTALPHFVKNMPPIAGIVADGLIEYLDAGRGVVVDPHSGGVVRWDNQSPSGGDFVAQKNPALRPAFVARAAAGQPAVAFGGGKALTGSNADAFRFTWGMTWFAVVEPRIPPGRNPRNNFFFGTMTNVDQQWLGLAAGVDASGSPFAFLRPATGVAPHDESQYVLAPDLLTGPSMLCCRLEPSECMGVLYLNRDEVARRINPYWGTRFDGGALAVGCARTEDLSETFNGRVYEILIYDRSLLDEERAAVENYLTRKYKLN